MNILSYVSFSMCFAKDSIQKLSTMRMKSKKISLYLKIHAIEIKKGIKFEKQTTIFDFFDP
jgi:hypothetical protein